MFIDTATIHLKAGNGGDGAIAWRREKYEPSGGPDGGDGGDGGSIFIEADANVHTLMDFKYKLHYKATSGENGRKKKQYGKKGDDVILKVPVGTTIRESNSGVLLADLRTPGERFLVVRGGKGGKGNAKFANSIRQAPRFAQPGTLGRELSVKLEVKLIADVGLVGLPNVGKSSLLSTLSEAKPKIANYHFTTLEPNLGFVRIDPESSYVIADIPGLIEGASEGLGLGHDFLRHVERTRILCHVIDMSGSEGRDPLDDFDKIQTELEAYNEKLVGKVELVVANKMDIPGSEENLARFKEKHPDYEVLETSAATTQGVRELKFALWNILKDMDPSYEALDVETTDVESFFEKDDTITVEREGHTIYVKGQPLVTLTRKVIIDDEDSINFLENSLETMGVLDRVRELDPTSEDVIDVEGFQFDWFE